MDVLDELLEKLQEWMQKLLDALSDLQGKPEAELIPIPVRNRESRH